MGAHVGCGIPFLVLMDHDGKRAIYVGTLTDGRFVDDAERVERYGNAMRGTTAVALSYEDSLSLVKTVLP
ncbi:Scr1 family TA system antitoxin-like transcriptional regulator [Saccharothrix coeruleofusca]|uniref:Scr1 family TA system antitoxin-like transcriptional regulator n=1 Tax=Saccharothrix coeruleofusca TaxID=33919 RepID=UPI0027DB702D|nr:Scr1 family TA system antitoxin-like transcriptional regulator [Saccharothrix coeruleofusca]